MKTLKNTTQMRAPQRRLSKSKHSAEKLTQQIRSVGDLPDWAAVPIEVVIALTTRARASVYRDIAAGRLPQPFKQGSSTRWRIGDLRRALEQA